MDGLDPDTDWEAPADLAQHILHIPLKELELCINKAEALTEQYLTFEKVNYEMIHQGVITAEERPTGYIASQHAPTSFDTGISVTTASVTESVCQAFN